MGLWWPCKKETHMTTADSPEVRQNGSEPLHPPVIAEPVPVPEGTFSGRLNRILTLLRTVPEHGGES